MDARLLETLRTVHERGGVTAAAAALHVTPSAVSQQVRVLQREVGAVLLERSGRGVRLTPAGVALAAAAVDVAVAVERARAAVDTHRAAPRGTVRVSAFQSAAQMLLPGLLTRVARLGGIALECSDEDVAQAEFGALTADFDVVVAHRPDGAAGWGPGLRVEPLLREPLDVALWSGHPLAGRRTLEPADLVDEDWITVREGFPVAAVLTELAAQAGSPPRVVQRINDFHVVEALVAAGHGISLLPRYTTGRAGRAVAQDLRLVPLAGVRAGRQIEALLRPDRAERVVVRRVLDELRAQAREIERAAAA